MDTMAISMSAPLPFEFDGIRYSLCAEADVVDMNRLLSDVFTREDPPAVAVGLTPDEFEAFVRLYAQSVVDDGLTIIARDVASGTMAGAFLVEDAASPAPDGIEGLSAGFASIFDLFGRLEERVADERPPVPGELLHLFVLGVGRAFARRGIGQRLVEASLANGARRGYRTAVTEATNRVSQHIFTKLGFVSRGQVSYADYRRDGVAVFASIAEHGGPMSMVRTVLADP